MLHHDDDDDDDLLVVCGTQERKEGERSAQMDACVLWWSVPRVTRCAPLMMKDRTSQTLTGGGASSARSLMSKKSLSPQSEEDARGAKAAHVGCVARRRAACAQEMIENQADVKPSQMDFEGDR